MYVYIYIYVYICLGIRNVYMYVAPTMNITTVTQIATRQVVNKHNSTKLNINIPITHIRNNTNDDDDDDDDDTNNDNHHLKVHMGT